MTMDYSPCPKREIWRSEIHIPKHERRTGTAGERWRQETSDVSICACIPTVKKHALISEGVLIFECFV